MTKGNKKDGCIWVNLSDIRQMDTDDRRRMAFLLKIKSTYSNSIIYNYTPKSLASKLSLSEYHVKKFVGELSDKNLCFREGKHLCFRSINRSMDKKFRRKEIHIKKDDSINNIVDKLNLELMARAFDYQEAVRSRKSDALLGGSDQNFQWKDSVRDTVEDEKLLREGFSDRYIIGMRRLAKYLGLSVSKTAAFVKKCAKNGLFKIKHFVIRCTKDHFLMIDKKIRKYDLTDAETEKRTFGYYYTKNNVVYRYVGTEFSFSS